MASELYPRTSLLVFITVALRMGWEFDTAVQLLDDLLYCRFEFFVHFFSEFLDGFGKLRVYSPKSCTPLRFTICH